MKLVIDISEHDYDWIRRWAKNGTQVHVYDTLARYIAEGKVLSEEKDRKTGKWIPQYVSEPHWTGFAISCYTCSCCGRYNIPSYRSEYCPNCGAKMEVDG